MPMMGWGYGGYGPMAGYGYGGWDPFGIIWGILWVVFVVLVIALIVHWARGRGGAWRRGDRSALDILRERYAKGEIDRNEFEEKKKDLEES